MARTKGADPLTLVEVADRSEGLESKPFQGVGEQVALVQAGQVGVRHDFTDIRPARLYHQKVKDSTRVADDLHTIIADQVARVKNYSAQTMMTVKETSSLLNLVKAYKMLDDQSDDLKAKWGLSQAGLKLLEDLHARMDEG